MNKAKKKKIRDFVRWLSINLLAPILIPIFCIVLVYNCDLPKHTFKEIVRLVYFSGTYLFLGITIILSLFTEYKIIKKTGLSHIIVLLFLIGIMSLFYPSVIITDSPINSLLDLKEHSFFFLFFTTISIIYAVAKKWEIVKVKKQNSYHD